MPPAPEIDGPKLESLLDSWLQEENMPLDKRFVYFLLASVNICVVPISSFCSELRGFRVTLLEEDESVFRQTFQKLGEAIRFYLNSTKKELV